MSKARLAFAVLLVLCCLSPAVAAGTPGPPPASGGTPHTVTLVTGDRIQVDGDRATVLETAPGTRAFSVFTERRSLYVIPDQALPLLSAGRLDRRLFDVTGLVEQGYDDASATATPLILEYPRGIAPRQAPAARTVRALPAVNAVSAEVTKTQSAGFWAGVRGTAKVWLDARVAASLDRSVPQIGAPAAWARGFDGTGVTVAVLDSGIDEAHPDLAGRITGAGNFTDEPGTGDKVGHGTHVASTVAGVKGVAPGARILNGKVLQLEIVGPGVPTGAGRESWIIAGMQWAVDQGADIVNLSLGTSQYDGNDPLSRTVNALTATSGTLFVAAAGNTGPDHYSVGSPAAADAALAVGSVNRDETISSFSSLGPRLADGAVKPEVTAPGQDIVAARAAGARTGRPVDDLHSSMSGTSMAAPHVAGTAALLRQQHPDWDAAALRAVLTSTASFNPSYTVYEQGGGRVDADRATRQQVRAVTTTVTAGKFTVGTPQRSVRTVAYRNDTAEPVTLSLVAEVVHQAGQPAGPGTLTVEPATLIVPAGGMAAASVTADVTNEAPGAYSGRVVASGPDGLSLNTPVGFYKQGDEVDVTFRAVDRDGRPAEASLVLRTPRSPNAFIPIPVTPGGTYTLRLPAGDYALLGYIRTPDSSGRFDAELTVVADPELDVAQPNRTITLDARKGRRLGVSVPRDTDINGFTVGLEMERPELTLEQSLTLARGSSYGTLPAVPLSILRFDQPERGHGNVDTYWSLVSPRARAVVNSPRRLSLPVTLMDGSARVDGARSLTVVAAGNGRPEDYAGLDVTGKLVLLRETDDLTYTQQARAAAERGAAAVLLASAQPGSFYGEASAGIPVLAVTRDTGDEVLRQLHRGPVRVTLSGTPSAEYLYDLAFRERDRLGGDLVYRPRDLAAVRTSYHAMDGYRSQRFFTKRFPAPGQVCGYCGLLAREGEDWHGGRTRTEYVTAGLPWNESVLQDGLLQWSGVRTYPPGATVTSYGRAPVVPGVPIATGVRSVRDGDTLRLRLSPATDGDPVHNSTGLFGWGRYTSVTRNGTTLGTCGSGTPLTCNVTVPADRATYTVTADFPAPGPAEAFPPSRTAWTFTSAPGEQVLPLLDLDYTLPVSLANTMRAGSPTALWLGVRHQPGVTTGPVHDVRVELSYDDGAHWTAVPVHSLLGGYVAGYRHPATAGFVGLRVTATDAQGNGIVQEVKRAYRLT